MLEPLVIRKGDTFTQLIRWETSPIVYKAITAITQGAPARITASAHGMPDGWNVAVVSAKGMEEINSSNPPKAKDYHKATVINGDTIEINDINSSDFSAYRSGGYIQYNTPADLTVFTASMSIKDKIGGTELLALTTENGRIVIDAINYTITLKLTAAETEALTWTNGVYDLEMIGPAVGGISEVTTILPKVEDIPAKIIVTKEVTAP